MHYTISRPHNDSFSYGLFQDLVKQVTVNHDSYYIWATPPEFLRSFLTHTDFGQTPNVIIGIKDLLDLWTDYNYWHQKTSAGTQLLDQAAKKYPDTNFVIFTSLENLDHEYIESPNIQIIPWGGDCVNQADAYQHLAPVLEKNFSSNQHVISLNRNLRDHRIVYISYLMGEGLDINIDLSCLGIYIVRPEFEPRDFLDRIFWEFDEASLEHDRIRSSVLHGYTKFFNNRQLIVDDYDIYKSGGNDNLSNFNNCLRARYQNSFVEIVTESSFASPGYMLTEKTMHSFYACNFPIILAGQGAVAHLRAQGFDMFDDIVDHSYDQVQNPIDRIAQAVDRNRQLFIDGKGVKQLWRANQARFINNVHTANSITDYYGQRARERWSRVQWK